MRIIKKEFMFKDENNVCVGIGRYSLSLNYMYILSWLYISTNKTKLEYLELDSRWTITNISIVQFCA